MPSRVRRCLSPLAALALVLVAVLALAGPSLAADPQRHVLPGGLTVITQENHEAPVAAFQVWVRAGSALERPGEYGITHLIEHMIFKGTEAHPAGTMARRIEALGGEVNAYTTLDHTNYYVSAASQFAPEALELLADAVVNASFDAGELKREKEVVVEEIRMNQDNPRRMLSWRVMAETFGKDHPYGRPVIGSIKSVRAISRDDILKYRARWYTAPNMMVVAVGDFDSAKLLPLIQKAFTGLPTGAAPDFTLPPASAPAGPRLVVMHAKVRQAHLAVTWRIPGLPSPEVYPMDMAAEVAGGGETSRLWTSLKEDQGLVDGVDAYSYTPQGLGMFGVDADLAPDKVEAAWRPMITQTLGLITQPPKAAELKRARVNLAADFVRTRQAMAAQARMLGYFEMFHGGFEKMAAYLERFRQTGAGQVASAAQRYFRPESLLIVAQVPEGAPAPDQAQVTAFAQKAFAGLKAAEAAQAEGPVKKVIAPGVTLLYQHRGALPLVAYTLAAPGGQDADGLDQAGRMSLWAKTITRGAAGRSYREITTELEDMAASLGGFSGKSTSGLTGSFLSQDWRRGLEMLAQTWLQPDFPAEQVAKMKEEQLAALRQQQNSPVARAFIAFRRLVYGDHPYGNNALGSPEKVKAFTRADLEKVQARVRGPEGLVLSVVGDVPLADLEAEVARLFGAAKGKVEPPKSTMVQTIAQPRDKKITDPEAKQTQIALGWVTPPAKDPISVKLHVVQAILGGQGGRLFSDLRDKRSLAYAVQPFYAASLEGGVFGVYMGVGPGKEQAALAGLGEHLGRLHAQAPSDQELERAKQYLIGEQAIGLQDFGACAATMASNEMVGLGYDYHLRYAKAVQAVTAADVRAAVEKVLNPQHRAELTQGPQG